MNVTDEEVMAAARAVTIFTMKRAGFWKSLPTEPMQERAISAALPEGVVIAKVALEAAAAARDTKKEG